MARIVRLEDKTPLVIPKEDGPVAVCRCGLSAGWPMCDGSHKQTREEGEGLYAYRRVQQGADLERTEVDPMPEADPRPPGRAVAPEQIWDEAERQARR